MRLAEGNVWDTANLWEDGGQIEWRDREEGSTLAEMRRRGMGRRPIESMNNGPSMILDIPITC